MSDWLSPIYVVFDNNEADSYWGLVGVMRMMVRLNMPQMTHDRIVLLTFVVGGQLPS